MSQKQLNTNSIRALGLALVIFVGLLVFSISGGLQWLGNLIQTPARYFPDALSSLLNALIYGAIVFVALSPWLIYFILSAYFLRPRELEQQAKLETLIIQYQNRERELAILHKHVKRQTELFHSYNPLRKDARGLQHEQRGA